MHIYIKLYRLQKYNNVPILYYYKLEIIVPTCKIGWLKV